MRRALFSAPSAALPARYCQLERRSFHSSLTETCLCRPAALVREVAARVEVLLVAAGKEHGVPGTTFTAQGALGGIVSAVKAEAEQAVRPQPTFGHLRRLCASTTPPLPQHTHTHTHTH